MSWILHRHLSYFDKLKSNLKLEVQYSWFTNFLPPKPEISVFLRVKLKSIITHDCTRKIKPKIENSTRENFQFSTYPKLETFTYKLQRKQSTKISSCVKKNCFRKFNVDLTWFWKIKNQGIDLVTLSSSSCKISQPFFNSYEIIIN